MDDADALALSKSLGNAAPALTRRPALATAPTSHSLASQNFNTAATCASSEVQLNDKMPPPPPKISQSLVAQLGQLSLAARPRCMHMLHADEND